MATTKKTTRAKGSSSSNSAKTASKSSTKKAKSAKSTTAKSTKSTKTTATKKTSTAKKAAPAKKTTTKKATSSTAGKKTTGSKKTAAKKPAKKTTSAAKKTGARTTAKSSSAPKKKTVRKPKQETKYALHQQLVYPLQGVGEVIELQEREFKGETLLYYIIYLEVSDMTVMVPIDKADQLGIRAIVKPSESNKALKHISEDFEPVNADWKLRYQMNLDLLKSGSIMDIATVVRTLYHRSRVKELPILERKLFDNALRLMVDEISFSLDKTKDEVEQLIFSRLEAD